MKDKKIIWDLFGGGVNSVYHALKNNDDFEVYTFDLVPETEHQNQHVIDLSKKFQDLKEYFSKLPKPDIIVASPLCQSFSSVLTMKGGGTCFWEYENESKTSLKERSIENFNLLKSGFTKNLKSEKQLFLKRLGEKCINNTIDLIKEFKPKYFYIENPKNSLIWKYIQFNRNDFFKNDFIFNKCFYSAYGYSQPKPTIFLSNINFELDNTNHLKKITENGYKIFVDKNGNQVSKMRNGDRLDPKNRTAKFKTQGTFQAKEAALVSHIPKKLIRTIFEKFN